MPYSLSARRRNPYAQATAMINPNAGSCTWSRMELRRWALNALPRTASDSTRRMSRQTVPTQRARPFAGAVGTHGLPDQYAWIGSRHRLTDWTDGCIAVTNQE